MNARAYLKTMKSCDMLCDPKLGSISSLRCQKSRTRVPKDDACEVMFSRTILMEATCSSFDPSGGARRDRTDDLMLAKHALSQLSYGPVPEDECLALDQDGGPGKT